MLLSSVFFLYLTDKNMVCYLCLDTTNSLRVKGINIYKFDYDKTYFRNSFHAYRS